MPIQPLVIPYTAFQSGKIIDPIEHNSNNLALQAKVNELINELNTLNAYIESLGLRVVNPG